MIWMWDGPQEEFSAPIFNQGVSAIWHNGSTVELARHCIHTQLQLKKVPVVRLEWFHVRHSPHYHRARMNLHVMAVLDYNPSDDAIFVVDRTAVPLSFGGLSNSRGWIKLNSLERAIERGFGVLEYKLAHPLAPWPEELIEILRCSISTMLGAEGVYDNSKDHGLYAIDGLMWLLKSATEQEVSNGRMKQVLGWHLPGCIRKFVIGTRQMLRLALSELSGLAPEDVAAADLHLVMVNQEWDLLATSLSELGLEGGHMNRARAIRSLINLSRLEREMIVYLEAVLESFKRQLMSSEGKASLSRY